MIRRRPRVPLIPISVALLQLGLVTWVPVADSYYHSGTHPVTTSEDHGGNGGDGSGLAPVCFVCAASLGAFASASPELAPAVSEGWTPTPEAKPESLPSAPRVRSTQARAPPLA